MLAEASLTRRERQNMKRSFGRAVFPLLLQLVQEAPASWVGENLYLQ